MHGTGGPPPWAAFIERVVRDAAEPLDPTPWDPAAASRDAVAR
jgi:hypothetical protein